ncbi:PID-CTERM protein-sorting domain-containing protein [Lutibacter sp.]
MKNRFNKYLLSFLLVLSCAVTFAQITPPPPGPPPPPGLPIDGGLVYLLLSGIAFGVFKIKHKK